jgi:hypothetical protein
MTLLVVAALAGLLAVQGAGARGECGDWIDCRTRALEAAERKDYETLHDLAWRAVQKGPPADWSLLFLLARAQTLSGRPLDALVMLRRIAPSGAAREALTSDDFARVRALAGWPEVEAAITARLKPDTTRREVVSGFSRTGSGTDESLTFDAGSFTPIALTYDRVSRRFIIADSDISRLAVVDEFSRHLATLASGASAGFGTVTAIEIDPRVGNLWVASVEGERASLHQLQLISARTLKAFPARPPARRLVDLAVARDGTVFAVDSGEPGQLLKLRPGARSLEVAGVVTHVGMHSVAVSDAGAIYVALPDGVSRFGSGPLKGDLDLARIARIRWIRGSLVGFQAIDGGAYRLVRIRLTRDGLGAASLEVLNPSVRTSHPALTVVDDVLYYLAQGEGSQIAITRVPLR